MISIKVLSMKTIGKGRELGDPEKERKGKEVKGKQNKIH